CPQPCGVLTRRRQPMRELNEIAPQKSPLMTPDLKWGLIACGRSGLTGVDLDQSCGPEGLLALEISTPNWSVRFRIPERDIIQRLASFLSLKSEESIIVWASDGTPVEVRRDREYGDRFFIVIGQGCGRTELIIAGQQEV